jgi:hypothetical protein
VAVAEASPENRVVVSEVDIPPQLQDNILLKVIRGQIRTLIEEMDNTKERSSPKKIDGLPGADVSYGAGRRGHRIIRPEALWR